MADHLALKVVASPNMRRLRRLFQRREAFQLQFMNMDDKTEIGKATILSMGWTDTPVLNPQFVVKGSMVRTCDCCSDTATMDFTAKYVRGKKLTTLTFSDDETRP